MSKAGWKERGGGKWRWQRSSTQRRLEQGSRRGTSGVKVVCASSEAAMHGSPRWASRRVTPVSGRGGVDQRSLRRASRRVSQTRIWAHLE
jgi:hypothetical protein